MKKLFLLLCLPVCSWAQFSQGNKFIGGSVNINNQNNSTSSPSISLSQNIGINPSIGFLIKDNLAIGVRLGYTKSYTEYILTTPFSLKSINSDVLNGGLFARRYFTISEKFLFAIDGSVNYGRGTITYETQNNSNIYGGNNTKYYSVTAQISPTFIYFPSQHWGVEATIGSLAFTHSYNFINEINSNTFNLNYGSFSLGFAYYIR
jgi:hypothetical protein